MGGRTSARLLPSRNTARAAQDVRSGTQGSACCTCCAAEHMSKVGIFLRQRRLLPDGKLKTFLDTHCPRLEVYGP